jgi:hypothetical protein
MTTTLIRPDRFPAVERDSVTFQVDRYGFPVEVCRRCGGSGEYSYNPLDGTRCFGCSGAGVAYASRIPAQEREAWRKELRAARDVCAWKVQPGDRIRPYGSKRGTPFQTVAAVELGEPDGWMKVGSAAEVVTSYRATLTFEDGTKTGTSNGGELWIRDATVDPAPYVERAQLAMVVKLKRRAR